MDAKKNLENELLAVRSEVITSYDLNEGYKRKQNKRTDEIKELKEKIKEEEETFFKLNNSYLELKKEAQRLESVREGLLSQKIKIEKRVFAKEKIYQELLSTTKNQKEINETLLSEIEKYQDLSLELDRKTEEAKQNFSDLSRKYNEGRELSIRAKKDYKERVSKIAVKNKFLSLSLSDCDLWNGYFQKNNLDFMSLKGALSNFIKSIEENEFSGVEINHHLAIENYLGGEITFKNLSTSKEEVKGFITTSAKALKDLGLELKILTLVDRFRVCRELSLKWKLTSISLLHLRKGEFEANQIN